MTELSPVELVRRYSDAWSTGELDGLDRVCAPEISVYYPGRPEGIHSLDALKRLIAGIRHVVPDLSLTIDELLPAGDRVTLRWTARGTQNGPWNSSVAPTHAAVTWTGISLYRVAGGRIVEERVEEDMLGLLRQIGVVVDRTVSGG